jgi:outer membrane protein assembly factor BamB
MSISDCEVWERNMMLLNKTLRSVRAFMIVMIWAELAAAQTPSYRPIVSNPKVMFTVNPGFRDWGPTTIAGTTIIGGNSSGRGGLFAVDTVTGKLKWSLRPTGLFHGSPFVATRPAVIGGTVVVPMGNTLVAVSLATGREMWRGIRTAQGATVAADADTAYVLGDDNYFYAFNAATGRQKWKIAFSEGIG